MGSHRGKMNSKCNIILFLICLIDFMKCLIILIQMRHFVSYTFWSRINTGTKLLIKEKNRNSFIETWFKDINNSVYSTSNMYETNCLIFYQTCETKFITLLNNKIKNILCLFVFDPFETLYLHVIMSLKNRGTSPWN